MKTMERICKRFEKENPGFECYLDTFDSSRGNYHVFIGNSGIGGWYWFGSISDFRQWAKYVVL